MIDVATLRLEQQQLVSSGAGLVPQHDFPDDPDPEPDEPDDYTAVSGMEAATVVVEDDSAGDGPCPDVVAPEVSTDNFFEHESVHALALAMALLQHYGPEWMVWEPETIEAVVSRDFGVPEIPLLTMDKIEAFRTASVSDRPWFEWEVFCIVAQAFTDAPVNFRVMWKPTPAEAAVAVDTLNQIRTDISWEDEDGADLRAFLSAVCRDGNVLAPPPPLDFVRVDTTDLVVDAATIRKHMKQALATGNVPEGVDEIVAEQLRNAIYIRDSVAAYRRRLSSQSRSLNAIRKRT